MEGYKRRMIEEYAQLKERAEKLNHMIVKMEADTLEFTPNCPQWLLQEQLEAMDKYKHILEVRAEYEGVDLYCDETPIKCRREVKR